jgi:hypothetical protein
MDLRSWYGNKLIQGGIMKLDIKAFGLTCGLVWGFGLFALTWWVIFFDGASDTPTFIGHLYRGYTLTPVGSLIGLVWALADGFVGGIVFAWLYNKLAGNNGDRQ